jgi:3-methyladenine DNA glycosylase AlkD
MTTHEIMQELASYGSDAIKKIFVKHGAKEPFFGVKVQDLKIIQKKVKKNHQLALELYATGNSDAMYLAGLIADESKMTKEDLKQWAENAYWYMISEFTVPWVTAESAYGRELALEWMQSDQEGVCAAGWATYSNVLALCPDAQLDKDEILALLQKVETDIHKAQNRVKQVMNGFVIAVGGSVPDLTTKALEIGARIGKVTVDMGGTACKTPFAPEYIDKIIQRGAVGKKKKTVRC